MRSRSLHTSSEGGRTKIKVPLSTLSLIWFAPWTSISRSVSYPSSRSDSNSLREVPYILP